MVFSKKYMRGIGFLLIFAGLVWMVLPSFLGKENKIVCDVTVRDSGLFRFADIADVKCAKVKSLVCIPTALYTLFGAEGKIKLITLSGDSTIQDFDLALPSDVKTFTLSVCSEDDYITIQLIDKEGKLRDEEVRILG